MKRFLKNKSKRKDCKAPERNMLVNKDVFAIKKYFSPAIVFYFLFLWQKTPLWRTFSYFYGIFPIFKKKRIKIYWIFSER